MRTKQLFFILALPILAVVVNASEFAATGDTFLWGYDGDCKATNYGTLERFSLNTVAPAGGSYSRGLIKFDLSAIPAGTIVSNSVIRLTQKDDNPTYYYLYIYESLKDWDEGSVTWNSFCDNDVAGPTAGVDYGTDLLALYPMSPPTQFGGPADGTIHSITISPEVVNGWISDPSSNKGMYLTLEVIGATQSSGWLSFWSEEDAIGRGPKLEFECDDCEVRFFRPGDINKDSVIDFLDIAIFFQQWLLCTDPGNISCQ